MIKFSALIIVLAALLQAMPSDTCNQNMWVTNGPVSAIAPAGDKVYIGGNFTQVGPYTGGGVPINTSTGAPVPIFPKFNYGAVRAACADGNGGWFVGGSFSSVGGAARNNIVHILSSGSVDPSWNPNANSSVSSLALSGTTVYAGGGFDTIGGQTRKHIAALDAATGNALAWNPSANNLVVSIAARGATVFAGGYFDTISGQNRNYIAALDATTGNATAWNPNANFAVNALAVSETTVYAAGAFSTIGGQSRSCIAALDATTGNATAWNPNANANGYIEVYSLAVSGTTVYVGGWFTSIGGQNRNYLAALDTTTGNATAWNPNPNSYYVYSLVVNGATVYAGGAFDTIGGQNRNYLAALDATTGNALAWNPNANGTVYSFAVSGTTIYVAGGFYSIGGQIRHNVAALDATTGKATAWNPNAAGGKNGTSVRSLAVSGTTVYAGGDFTSIGGQSRNYIAALDTATGNALAWNPDATGGYPSLVRSLAVSGAMVYVGGDFNSIGGQSRSHIAALDATTGNALAWNPNANDEVQSLAISGSSVYASGYFGSIGGQNRNYLAALDVTTGNATAWNPNPNNTVYSLAVSGTTVYAGGPFTNIGGQNRNYIAALDDTTGNALAWNPNAFGYYNDFGIFLGYVNSFAVIGTTVYAGGAFDTIGGQSRKCIAALDAATGNATLLNPNANDGVSALAVSGSTVYVGGGFTSIGQGIGHPNFARFDSVPGASPVTRPITSRSCTNNTGLQIIGPNSRSGAFVKFVYALPKGEHVSLRLYGINGQLQSEVVNKHQDAGNYSLSLQRGTLAAGAYLVVFKAGEYHQEKMISLTK